MKPLCVVLLLIGAAAAQNTWPKDGLSSQHKVPEIDVSGEWDSDTWGTFHLSQTTSDVRGMVPGYRIVGVVSGKQLFMLFLSDDTLQYCAVLSPDGDNLTGNYFYRKTRWKSEACQEKEYPMYMKRVRPR